MLNLRKISKFYGSVGALSDVSLDVPQGATGVVIGPSGCGKTTLVRLIMGLISPDEGEVIIDDELVVEENISGIRRRIGYVVQGGALFPHMTAWANVGLMPKYFGWSRPEISRKVRLLAEMMELPLASLDRYPGELSGGQRQRVSLMRALVLDPEMLVLDEPFGALDPMVRFQLQEHLRGLFRKLKKTVVMVTHDIAEAAFFADEIILMRAGKIVQRGPMSDLLFHPKEEFVTAFLKAQRTLSENIQGPQ